MCPPPAETEPRRSRRLGFGGALGAILLFAFSLRAAHLDSASYDLDEILQASFVQGTWTFFWESLRFDAVHPPLDYLITRAVEPLHPSDPVRKLPSVVWGIGTIAVLALLIRRRAGGATGLLAALLLAAAPFHVRFSQELRPYSLGLFLLSLSLLLLDFHLARPSVAKLVALYAAALATAYALYLAALALFVAGLALLGSDAFAEEARRRETARRALGWSPVFLLALLAAYLPWLPVAVDAARRPSPSPPPSLTFARLGRSFAFFAFGAGDGDALSVTALPYLACVLFGLALALRRKPLRFLAVWLLAISIAVEVLERTRPHIYVTRHYLTGGVAIPLLAAVGLAAIARWRRSLAVGLAVGFVLCDLASLRVYYREGRPDWRQLARYLRTQPPVERVFTENQYTALCVAFYVVGPDYLYRRGHTRPEVLTLEGDARSLAWSWTPGTTAWLVTAGGGRRYPAFREWATAFPGVEFPRAEGATVRRLDPADWGRMAASAAGVPAPKTR